MDPNVATEHQPPMGRALELAQRGRGRVSPNPLVGAVIVDAAGRTLGEGYHARVGEAHAEVAAIAAARAAGEDPAGATMYVTLEPCAHHGRQPPCTDAILAAGIGRVVVASDDPSPKASGRGPGILRDGGVEVEAAEGADAAAARLLNQPFRKHARTGRPFVALKSAMTLDGRTATASGDSKWISGPESRLLVHRWRAEADAVAVGIATALADDALLTARDVDAERQPHRIVFDSDCRLPPGSQLVATAAEAPVIVIAAAGADRDRVAALVDAGVEVIECPGDGADRVETALGELGRRGITSVLLEGGATIAGAFADAGELDELRLFYAPIVLGGADSRPLLGGAGAPSVDAADRALAVTWEPSGEDMLARVRLREW
ncbi:MAG: bifunctional diaminohydroxyphosphoribosylaminopyrimidine deaminase/5-amino-6-(5-phosphoribosylamino)uracil reductase RibD [Solirubrobacterales bacterium]|nr:bifunctional diaminohydroxyphosphoribosylaminopyrimidine deaminase/5-amino-6-(5-phosphoribosylamino)uracil reductase RibD [Solirubrobacterales bacterium]